MTSAEDLATARANYAHQLAEISVSPKPSYSVDGQSYSWTEYQQFLLAAIKGIDELTAASAPFCESTQVMDIA